MLTLAMAVALARATPPRWCAVVAEERGSGVLLFDPDGRRVGAVPVGAMPHEVEVAGDGRTAFVSQFGITDYDSRIGTPGDHVSRIDLATARETGRYRMPPGLRAPHGVKLRPGRGELFVNVEDGGDHMLVFDVGSRRLLCRFALAGGSHNFIFDRSGRLFVFAGAGGVARYDPDSGRRIARRDVGSPVRGLALMPDGTIAAGAKGEVVILSPADLKVVRRVTAAVPGQIVYLETLADGTIVAPSLADGGVSMLSPHRAARFVATGKTPIAVRRAPDGRLLVSNADDDHISAIRLPDASAARFATVATPNGVGFGVCPARRDPRS